jgi:hypothetical protein
MVPFAELGVAPARASKQAISAVAVTLHAIDGPRNSRVAGNIDASSALRRTSLAR